jgi:hypothetical protein
MSSTHRHLLLDFFWQDISGPPCIFFKTLNNNCGLDSKILTLSFLRGKCDEKLYRLNLALILITQVMWAEQVKSYNGNTITYVIYSLHQ